MTAPRDTSRCAAGMRCRAYQHDLGPAQLYTAVPLCDSCISHTQTTLRQLKHDWYDLAQVIARTSRPGEMISGSREAPIPIRVDVEAIQAEILHVLTTWETALRRHEHLSAPRPGRVRAGYAVHRATDLLHLMAPIVAALPPTPVRPTGPTDDIELVTGAQALLELPHLHDRAQHALGLTDTTTDLPGRCTGCGVANTEARIGTQPTLHRINGNDTVACRSCGKRITYDDYVEYADMFRAGWRGAR